MNYDFKTLLEIIVSLTAIGGIAAVLARFFSDLDRERTAKQSEIDKLTTTIELLKSSPDLPEDSVSKLKAELLKLSSEIQNLLQADIHSISLPLSLTDPTHLEIVLSTDKESEKVVGRKIPINGSIAGWVYSHKQPDLKNPKERDPKHFDLVDKVAGTKTGEGAILTFPLISGELCWGVIQFMKIRGGHFETKDIKVASNRLPRIIGLVIDLYELTHKTIGPSDTKVGTFMFTDITSYTAIADKILIPNSAVLLNEYFSRLLPLAIKHGGKLEEYLGDGMYISFFTDQEGAAASAAVKAALEMQTEYLKMLDGWKKFEQPVSDENFHRIGIATGDYYSRLMGPQPESRYKHVGPPINLAAHLCEGIKSIKKSLAICPKTKELASPEGISFKLHLLDEHKVWIADL